MALSSVNRKFLKRLEELMSNEGSELCLVHVLTGNTAPVFSARQLALGILCVLDRSGHYHWCRRLSPHLAGRARLLFA